MGWLEDDSFLLGSGLFLDVLVAKPNAQNLRQLFPGPLQFDLDGPGTLRGWLVVGWMWAPDPKRGPPKGNSCISPTKSGYLWVT